MVINASAWWWSRKADTRSTCDSKWASKVNFYGRLFTVLCISPSRTFILYASCRECLILKIRITIWIFLGLTFLLPVDGGAELVCQRRSGRTGVAVLTSNLWVSLCIWTRSERGVLQDWSQSWPWTHEPAYGATLVKSRRMLNQMPLDCRLIDIRTSHCDPVLMICDVSLTPHRCDWISDVCLFKKKKTPLYNRILL